MIGARSIIMPNVRIGNNVVIAAGSIVSKDISDNMVVGGIPAKLICSFEELLNKRRKSNNFAVLGAEKLWKRFKQERDEGLNN